MMEFFVTMEVISHWQSSSSLDDGGIVELPLYATIFSFLIKLEAWRRTKIQRTQAFHILVPFFFSWCEKYNFVFPLLRNGCSLIKPFVFWRFYRVLFESIPLFWKYWNKLQGCSKPRNFSFRNMKSFQPSILIKKTVSNHQSRGK